MLAQLISTALGVWLLCAPAVLDIHGVARQNIYIVAPLVASFAFIAVWEVTRGCRWLNVALGTWIVLSAFIWEMPGTARLVQATAGLLVVILSFQKGKSRHSYGGGWRALWAGPSKKNVDNVNVLNKGGKNENA